MSEIQNNRAETPVKHSIGPRHDNVSLFCWLGQFSSVSPPVKAKMGHTLSKIDQGGVPWCSGCTLGLLPRVCLNPERNEKS